MKANSRDVQLAYIEEVTPGVTPTTPAFKLLRATGEDLKVDRKWIFSSELDGKRGQKNASVIQRSGSGGYKAELMYGAHDEILEAMFRSTWATDVLVDGDTPKFFTFEEKFATGSPDIYKRLKGAAIDSWNLSAAAGQNATIGFTIQSLDSGFDNAIIAGATYTAANTNPVLNTGDFGSLTMSGLTVGCMNSVELTVNNNLDPVSCLGSLALTDFTGGMLEATAKLSIVLSEAEYDIVSAYDAGTATSLVYQIGRTAGSKYKVELPNVIIEDMNVAADSGDGKTVMLDISVRALQSATLSGKTIRLTRAI